MKSVLRDLPAWGISLVINLSVLLALHFVVFELESNQNAGTITSVMEELHETSHVFSTTLADQVGDGGTGGGGSGVTVKGSAGAIAGIGAATSTPRETLGENMVPRVRPSFPQIGLPTGESLTGNIVDMKGQAAVDMTGGGIEGAMDRITYEIASSLKQRQTLVLWMFDASQSLNERRGAIADRFENVYKQLNLMGAGKGLYTAVQSYGKETFLMTPEPVPADQVNESAAAVRKIKPDESGVENVFSSLKLGMEKYKAFHRHEGRWNKMVFIITDEKGDDAAGGLEDVINLSKRFGFRCYTVGNAATFGQEKGYVMWTYSDGFKEPLPVDQGPETAFPDVLQLPYWGSGGDARLQRMSAGYGPYALTRLCAETGGMFLITEDTAGGYKFDSGVMQSYMPDYRPVRVIEQEINKNVAKRALVEAARTTYVESIPTLTLVFFAQNDNVLRNEITEAQKPAATTDYWINRMYEILKQGESSRDSLTESRWRASFDLAMGRIMATKVRLLGYNLMLAQMKSTPRTFSKKGGNEWKLVPSREIDTGPALRKAADQARTYLKRVIDEHPGTPWEKLAIKELSQDMGWSWQEGLRYVPGMENDRNLDPEQVRLLLAEEERRQQQRRMAEKPRDKPKL